MSKDNRQLFGLEHEHQLHFVVQETILPVGHVGIEKGEHPFSGGGGRGNGKNPPGCSFPGRNLVAVCLPPGKDILIRRCGTSDIERKLGPQNGSISQLGEIFIVDVHRSHILWMKKPRSTIEAEIWQPLQEISRRCLAEWGRVELEVPLFGNGDHVRESGVGTVDAKGFHGLEGVQNNIHSSSLQNGGCLGEVFSKVHSGSKLGFQFVWIVFVQVALQQRGFNKGPRWKEVHNFTILEQLTGASSWLRNCNTAGK